METRVVAVTASHADKQADSLHEKQLRRITFNGKPLTSQQQRCLESLELSLGLRLPERDYWCDPLELWSGLKPEPNSQLPLFNPAHAPTMEPPRLDTGARFMRAPASAATGTAVLLGEKLEMNGENWMNTDRPHNPDPSMEERCAFYKWELDQLEAGLPRLKIAEATRLHHESD